MAAAERIDVLAVIDAEIARSSNLPTAADPYVIERHHAMVDARAAVAELIEADKEFDEAEDAWDRAPGGIQAIGDIDGRDYDGSEYRRLCRAIERRAAALSRVQGAGA